jgi:hypothetical protein
MARFYDPKTIYDPATMPLVEGWEETNGCTFIRFHWVLTEADQKKVDTHWRPDFYRHSLINAKMYLATSAGRGVPGWDPYLGYTEEEAEKRDYETGDGLYDNTLSTRIAQGRPIAPTGLAEDPRLPPREPALPSTDVVLMLQQAKERYEAGLQAEYNRLTVEHVTKKAGTWAERAALAGRPAPTLEDARKSYEARIGGPKEEWPSWASRPPAVPGVWHEWEIVEIERERARQDAVEAAWQRAEASYKSINPTWGGGT